MPRTVSAPIETVSPFADLDDALEASPLEQPPSAARHDEPLGLGEPQRGHVEVVVMDVREENGVQRADRRSGAAHAAQVPDSPAQQRVGQDAGAVSFEENGAVTDPA